MSKYEVCQCESPKSESSEWWVYGEGNRFGPYSTKGRAEEVAIELNKKGISTDKSSRGRILNIDGGLLTQDVGRGMTVLHDVRKLSEVLKVDDFVSITYKNGIGVVKEEKVKETGIER